MRRGKRYRQRQCRHLAALGIYGNGINVMRGRRGVCVECGLVLDSLPIEVVPTGRTPVPCLPTPRGDGYIPDPIFMDATGRKWPLTANRGEPTP